MIAIEKFTFKLVYSFSKVAVMSTHKEGCAATYWSIVTTMGLQGNDLTAYKFCHVTHNILRDGHPNVLPESAKHIPFLDNLSRLWVSVLRMFQVFLQASLHDTTLPGFCMR